MPANTSRLGRVSTWLGRLCLLTVFLGPALAHFFIAAPIAGFGVFLLGVAFGVLAVVTGLLALIVGPVGSRGATLIGIVLALVVVVGVLLMSGARTDIPRINDITTDTDNPPQFVYASTLPDNAGRDMAYPGATFAEQQKAGYKDLGPVTLAMSPDEAFKRVAAAARSMPTWVITREDAEAHALEGYDTTWLFHFHDDFVIEVRPTANGQSVVQMRSKSRDGKGDVGANAARIKAFFERLNS
jgi:uncharacterized protein (DUF1499 family)